MKMTVRALWVFVAVAAVQLFVPGYMIYEQETVLETGASYRFKTAPVDPYDPFRGRYVRLSMEATAAPVAPGEAFRRGERVFVLLGRDGEGFARLESVSRERPAQGDYLRLKVRSVSGDSVHLAMPFDRYYAEETLAPAIEEAYRRHSRRERRSAFVVVRVRDGRGVIEALYIDNLPVGEYLARQAASGEGG